MTKAEFISRDSVLGEILYDVFRRMYESATMSCSPVSPPWSTASPGSKSLPSLPEVESNGASAHLEVSSLTSDNVQSGEDSSTSAVTMETKK
ncbi:hypothetical protein ACJMK2_020939 [Sinanodonta woodiana]|uniref:Uncharacterized protein n=1 Tax=Sinanodonta woodiana TaxID=1069815 RepID=A0ABD3U0L0_SINWO